MSSQGHDMAQGCDAALPSLDLPFGQERQAFADAATLGAHAGPRVPEVYPKLHRTGRLSESFPHRAASSRDRPDKAAFRGEFSAGGELNPQQCRFGWVREWAKGTGREREDGITSHHITSLDSQPGLMSGVSQVRRRRRRCGSVQEIQPRVALVEGRRHSGVPHRSQPFPLRIGVFLPPRRLGCGRTKTKARVNDAMGLNDGWQL